MTSVHLPNLVEIEFASTHALKEIHVPGLHSVQLKTIELFALVQTI